MNITGKLLGQSKKDPADKFRLGQYLKDSKEELKKVSWPTRKETWKNTWIVIGFSLFFAAFLGALDYLFNYLLEIFLTK